MRKVFTLLSALVLVNVGFLHAQTSNSTKSLGPLKFECDEEVVVIGYCSMKVRKCEIVWRSNRPEMNISEMLQKKADTISPQGTVVDKLTGAPISGATIRWVGSSLAYTSDENGRFGMCAGPEKKNKLEVSSIGYETLIVDRPPVGQSILYRLSPIYKQLEEVIVVGYNKRMVVCGWSITGLRGKELSNLGSGEGTLFLCGVPGIYITASNYSNDSTKPVLPKAGIKLYPNPTRGGGTVSFKFNNESSGGYKIEIIDASGRIIQTEYVNILFKNQVISFSTSPAWTKGVYLVRISGKNSTNVEIGKLAIN